MALTKQTSTFSVPNDSDSSVRQAVFLAERAALSSMPDGPKSITVKGALPDPQNPGHTLVTVEVEPAAA